MVITVLSVESNIEDGCMVYFGGERRGKRFTNTSILFINPSNYFRKCFAALCNTVILHPRDYHDSPCCIKTNSRKFLFQTD